MKISYNWLKQYININIEPEVLSKILTNCGLEVEALEKFETIKGGLKGVVVGHVLSREKHPDADRLSLTKVDIGNAEPLSIVCGAPNVDAGQKVLVATIGTKIYSDKGDFEIKKSTIRGQLSEGMICAEDELGLGTSHAGIMVLNPDAKVGTHASEYFNIETDWVFEIGLTPNRVDASSHIGVARDIVAVLNLSENKKLKLNIPEISNFKIDNNNLNIPVEIADLEACPRYSGITVSGVKVQESPDWLKNRLKAVGLRPINNIVDITNYILLELGQPLHAFDADMIDGKKVVIRKANEGEIFKTLDGIDRKLTKEDLMICNQSEEMCIAGVFGGEKSGVTENTKNIFIESAYFNPSSIRKTSKHHGLKTDASFRFERGTDPNITVYALKRAALLIKEIAGGTISSEIIDVYPKKIENFKFQISYNNINRIIGKTIEKQIVKNILESLEIKILSEKDDILEISVSPFKVDVQREIDVIEEILRIYGYNNIEFPAFVKSSLTIQPKPDKEKIRNKISDYLTSNGFYEILCNSLTKSEYSEIFKSFPSENNVKILNPLSKELDVMRQTLLFSGLESILHNQNRKNPDIKFYEFGKTYTFNSEAKKTDSLSQYSENEHLSIFISGKQHPESWKNNNNHTDFYYLKAYVNNILAKLGVDKTKLTENDISNEIFAEGINYKFNSKNIVDVGQLGKSVLKHFDIKQNVFYADFNLENLFKLVNNDVKSFELPKFPEVRRDLALLIDKNINFTEIENIAFQTEKKLLKSVNLFDIYQGEKIEENKKSYAVSFILQDNEKTLADNEIDKITNKLIKAYEEKLNAIIRK